MPMNKTMSQIRPRARINNHALIPCLRESLFIYLFIKGRGANMCKVSCQLQSKIIKNIDVHMNLSIWETKSHNEWQAQAQAQAQR
jgi:hypothetical protein